MGVGLNTIEVGNGNSCRQPQPDEAGAVMGHAISVPLLRRSLNLSFRRLAGHLEKDQPLDLTPVEEAAEGVPAREEEFIYYGPHHSGCGAERNRETRRGDQK